MELLCRTCMSLLPINLPGSTLSYNIFETLDLADKLQKCCSFIQILPHDYYPPSICCKCYELIEQFCMFQEMYRNSIEKFDEILNLRHGSLSTKNVEVVSCSTTEITPNSAEVQTVCGVTNPLELPECNEVNQQNCMAEGSEETHRINEGAQNKDKVYGIKLRGRRPKHKVTSVRDRDDAAGNAKSEHSKSEASISDSSDADITAEPSSCRLKFQCNICTKKFLVQHRLEDHRKQHEEVPTYNCSQEGLKRHNGSRQSCHKCDIDSCDRVYKNKSALNLHRRKYHKCGRELKSHMCEICGKVFKSSAVLNDHRFTHVDRSQLPYVCDVEGCSKRFSNKEKLKIHKLRHAGIKNYICPHCGMRKTTRNELKIHINYHTLERTWPCNFCTKVCNSAGNLKMHVRNIHERAKDFACRFCDRTFAKADTRKYHEMTHTGEKPHACGQCGRRFLQPAALRTHRKIHLKESGNKVVNNCAEHVTEVGCAPAVEVASVMEEVSLLDTVAQSNKIKHENKIIKDE